MRNTAYTPEEIENRLNTICEAMSDKGQSLRTALKEIKISSKTFYSWIDQNEDDVQEIQEIKLKRVKQYIRACEERADYIAEDNHTIVQRAIDKEIPADVARIAVDVNKWHAGKLRPKVYGNQIDITSGGEKVNHSIYEVREVIIKESTKQEYDNESEE